MKKYVHLLFPFLALPSVKGGLAKVQARDFQKHPCQLRGLQPPSLSLSTVFSGV